MEDLKLHPDDERGKETSDPAGLRVVRVPETIYPYSAGIRGGFFGGAAMIPVALAYGILSGKGIWYPVNLIAATVIPAWQHATVAELSQFHPQGLAIGLAIHLLMSIFLGFLFTFMMPTLPKSPIFWALVIGPVLWGGAIYAGLPLFNPIMAQYIDLPSFALANIVYGLVLGIWVARAPKIHASDLNLRNFLSLR